MTLCLHRGAKEIDYDGLRARQTPSASPTHIPIPHYAIVDMLRYSLPYFGHEIVEEHHGLTDDGMRYFGLLSLRSSYGGYEDTVGLRNSHDKTFPIGIAFGSRVFVCDNLAFLADYVIRRKHTQKAKRDLPGLVGELVEPLAVQRAQQHKTFDRFRQTVLTDQSADHAIMMMYRKGIINVQRIPDVLDQWNMPKYEEWGEKTAWRLFNAATFALTGKVSEDPGLTRQLHTVIDSVCEVA